MRWKGRAACLTAAAIVLAGCQVEQAADNSAAEPAAGAQGEKTTLAASLDQNSQFVRAVAATGLDSTLDGAGPYTLLVPDDRAFAALPGIDMNTVMEPQQRARLTDVLTYHILPGTVLAEDIGKAIDNGKGKAVLATMGGETLSAERDGDRIVLIDSSGNRANITEADQQRSNGVLHRIDAILVPGDRAPQDDGG